MIWIVVYTLPNWPGQAREPQQQLFTQWVCPVSMDQTAALWSFQCQNPSATVISITASPRAELIERLEAQP